VSGCVRPILVLLLTCGLSLSAARAQEGEDETPLPERPEATEPIDACPCFDPAELAELPGTKWDLCVDAKATLQVARWFGKRSPEGKEGFNVIATRPSARTMGGSCLLLRRFRIEGVLEQVHSRILDLSNRSAIACHGMLEAWLDSRGGCETVVVEANG